MASFKEAFAKARKDGKRTFSWQGKKYNTKVKQGNGVTTQGATESPKPKSMGSSRGGGPGSKMTMVGGSGSSRSSAGSGSGSSRSSASSAGGSRRSRRSGMSSSSSGSSSASGGSRRSSRTSSSNTSSSRSKSPAQGGLVTGKTKTKGGNYPSFKKDSTIAKDFRSAFAKAKRDGKSTFMWDGRKYSTKTK